MPAHHEKLKHIVERSGIAHARLYYRSEVGTTEFGRMKHTFTSFHPHTVTLYRVDFTIMPEHTERLRKRHVGNVLVLKRECTSAIPVVKWGFIKSGK